MAPHTPPALRTPRETRGARRTRSASAAELLEIRPVDRELQGHVATLEALATSIHLDGQRERAGRVAQALLAAGALVAMQHDRQQDRKQQQQHEGAERQREEM